MASIADPLVTSSVEAQKIFQEVGDKAAESVACVHLAQALVAGGAGGGGVEVLGFFTRNDLLKLSSRLFKIFQHLPNLSLPHLIIYLFHIHASGWIPPQLSPFRHQPGVPEKDEQRGGRWDQRGPGLIHLPQFSGESPLEMKILLARGWDMWENRRFFLKSFKGRTWNYWNC